MLLLNNSREIVNDPGLPKWRAAIESGKFPDVGMKTSYYWFCWTVFTMYWPSIMCCALVGKE